MNDRSNPGHCPMSVFFRGYVSTFLRKKVDTATFFWVRKSGYAMLKFSSQKGYFCNVKSQKNEIFRLRRANTTIQQNF